MKRFTVKGTGAFPIDMLRYDACWPDHAADAIAIQDTYHRRERQQNRRFTVTLCGVGQGAPTVARWESFGVTIEAVQPL